MTTTTPQRYIKKPVTIDAIQWDGNNTDDVIKFCPTAWEANGMGRSLAIETLEGVMHASVGDFIIKGVEGEFYPVKPSIFFKTYAEEEAEEAL